MAKDLENIMEDNNVFILTNINAETTNGLIIQLTQWLNNLPFQKRDDTFYKTQKIKTSTDSTVFIINAKQAEDTLYKPTEIIPEHIPVLNVYINSNGGNHSQTFSLLSLFDQARAKGAIIRTHNIAHADSCASMIAVSGTKGYRYMAQHAYQVIHYGTSTTTMKHPSELDYINIDFNRAIDTTSAIYLNRTNLKKDEINQYYNIEGSGLLNAEQCLEKGICDWVITNDGRFVNDVKELRQIQR